MLVLAETQFTVSIGLAVLFAICGILATFFGKVTPAICCLAVAILVMLIGR